MSLPTQEQFKQFIDKSKDVLILIPENPSGDAVGSAWALYYFLAKKNINATVAFSNHLEKKYNFLPKPEKILTEISGARDLVLSFNTTYNKIHNFRTEELPDKFNIYLTPEKGMVDPRDFSFILAKFKYDLMVVIDSPDFEKLGKLYEKNPDLFFEVPIINIDHRSDNDNFGQINLVDTTASSCSEILSHALEEIDANLIDTNIANCLLTGIISATESFQNKKTTPKSLQVAADLMAKGADQQVIIRWLYKTQPLHILKLWGRAMTNLNWDEQTKMAWVIFSIEDFVQSRSNPDDVLLVLEKLQENYSEGKIFMAVYNDTPISSVVIIKSAQKETLEKINSFLDGNLKRNLLEIKFNHRNLTEIGESISKKIKETSA